jgi:hypothetical protein
MRGCGGLFGLLGLSGASAVRGVSGPMFEHRIGFRLWVPETRLMSCDLLIFVDESTEPVESADAGGVGLVVFWECA